MLIFHPFTLPWSLGVSTLCKLDLNLEMTFLPIIVIHFDYHGLFKLSCKGGLNLDVTNIFVTSCIEHH